MQESKADLKLNISELKDQKVVPSAINNNQEKPVFINLTEISNANKTKHIEAK
jgi:hypothetical protein